MRDDGPRLKPQYTDPMTHIWCVAETVEAADKLARLHLSGAARSPYLFECDCLAAWRSQPLPMAARYHPYRSEVALSPTGLYVLSTSRIGGEHVATRS